MHLKYRGIKQSDLYALQALQNQTDNIFDLYNFVADSLEDDKESDYAYGAFVDDVLVAQCSIGGAEVVEDDVPCYEETDELLSDVYVHMSYRGSHIASNLIRFAVSQQEHKNNKIYCEPINDTTSMYQKLGFVNIDEYILCLNRD